MPDIFVFVELGTMRIRMRIGLVSLYYRNIVLFRVTKTTPIPLNWAFLSFFLFCSALFCFVLFCFRTSFYVPMKRIEDKDIHSKFDEFPFLSTPCT